MTIAKRSDRPAAWQKKYRRISKRKVLLAVLPGYANYVKKVRYRLIPLVW